MGPRKVMVAAVGLLIFTAAGCGGSSSSSSGGGGGGGSLVAKVSHAQADVQDGTVVASAKVKEGGKPGEHLTLRWGLIDAVSGVRASEEEALVARYTTTSKVEDETATIHFKKPTGGTDYLVHFALYAPDGSYLSSADSKVFSVVG